VGKWPVGKWSVERSPGCTPGNSTFAEKIGLAFAGPLRILLSISSDIIPLASDGVVEMKAEADERKARK